MQIQSRLNAFKVDIPCLVIKRITNNIPHVSFDANKLNIPRNCFLADPGFSDSGDIKILIGAQIFWDLFCTGQIKLGKDLPILQKSHFGWVVSGPLPLQSNSRLCNLSLLELNSSLTKFWEIEDYPRTKVLSSEEELCENHFSSHTKRSHDGRFIVTLPFKESPSCLGDTKGMALRRFHNIERKLHKNTDLYNDYKTFIDEYLHLGHMSLADSDEQGDYFLPHHGVYKESSTTTRLRVVFDASAKSSSGKSLNDIMMVGPTIQDDIFSVILRFRLHDIVATADIAKMYRQVLVDESQQKL